MSRPVSPRRRVADWPERLAGLVEGRMLSPFAWGLQDCVTLAADAVAALTDVDPLASLRGTYATEAEAEAIIARDGNLYRLVCRLWAEAGLPQCPPALAQRGDTAWVQGENDQAMGVVLGAVVAVPGADRLRFHPASAILRAWVT